LEGEAQFEDRGASRIKDYSAELVKSVPDIIVANGSPVLASMKQATRSTEKTGQRVTITIRPPLLESIDAADLSVNLQKRNERRSGQGLSQGNSPPLVKLKL
jgi:hypothetical protein